MMREWMKRLIAIALCVTLVASLAACGNNSNKNPTNNTNSNSNGDETDDSSASSGILDDDEAIYMDALGDFYEIYQQALEAETLSERHALMAIAEAKFLEIGVGTPLYTAGGCYAMSRLAYRTGGYIS